MSAFADRRCPDCNGFGYLKGGASRCPSCGGCGRLWDLPETSGTGAPGGPCTKCPSGDHSPTRHGQLVPPPVTSAEEGDEVRHLRAWLTGPWLSDKKADEGLRMLTAALAAHTRRAVEAEGERIAKAIEAEAEATRLRVPFFKGEALHKAQGFIAGCEVAAAIARGGAE